MTKHQKTIRMIVAVSAVLILIVYGLWELMNSRSFQVFGELVNRVNTEEKIVALTFDDAPGEKTPIILDLLKEKNITATFYLIGKQIEQYPDIAREIVSRGYEVGNHSYSHERMVFKSMDFIEKEITETNKLIRLLGFEGEITFRPPNGKKLLLLPFF